MRTRARTLLLSSLIVATWVASSNVLTLCVHADHVGFEASWATCCETASCCEREAARQVPAGHQHLDAGHDGCQDFTLALGADWVPDPGPRLLALDAWALLPLTLHPAGPAPLEVRRTPRELRGVPPPPRPQRSPILRC